MKHLLMTALLALPIGFAAAPNADAADTVLRFGSSGPEKDAVFSGAMKEFKKAVEDSTDGAVEVHRLGDSPGLVHLGEQLDSGLQLHLRIR